MNIDELGLGTWGSLRQEPRLCLLLDRDLRLIDANLLAARMLPGLDKGIALQQYFEVVTPRGVSTPDGLIARLGGLVLAAPKAQGIAVRGHLRSTADPDIFRFSATPWLAWMQEHRREYRFGLNDFPADDPQLDMLFVGISERAHLADLERAMVELESARRQLVESSQSQAELFAMMSHEMRTPLAGMIGSLQLLESDRMESEQRKLLRIATTSAENLLGVVDKVLDFAKLEAGSLDAEADEFDVAALVDSVAALVSRRARDKGLELKISLAADLPRTLIGDSVLLQHVLLNLATNAVKYTTRGMVQIEASAERCEREALLRISVSDTGPGIAEPERENVFRKFWTAGNTARLAQHRSNARDIYDYANFSSTGLGLYTAQRIMNQLGGRLILDPQYSPGARFELALVLPLGSDTPATLAANSQEDLSIVPLEGRVLLVEDTLPLQLLTRMTLERMGLEVVTAEDGEQALRVLEQERVDVVILDINLPVLDGWETIRRIRAHPRLGTLPAIAFTAHVGESFRHRAREYGFDEYLTKPAIANQLNQLLKRYTRAREEATVAQRAVAPDAAGASEMLDPLVMQRLLQDVGAAADLVLQTVIDDISRRLPSIEHALSSGDIAAVARDAHSMKSSAATFGATAFAGLCRELESAAGRGDTERSRGLAAQLEAMAPLLIAELRRQFASRTE